MKKTHTPLRAVQKSKSGRSSDGFSISQLSTLTTANLGERKPNFQLVLDTLLRGFDSGEYQPGMRLNAAEIAEKLGLSRAPVREALFMLAGFGIVEILPDRGAVLRRLSATRLIETFQVLDAILGASARLAAQNISAGDNWQQVRSGLDEVLAVNLDKDLDTAEHIAFTSTLHNFHHVLNHVGGNTLLHEMTLRCMLDYFSRNVLRFVNFTDYKGMLAVIQDNYRRLGEAVLAGDALGAQGILSFHTNWWINSLQSMLKSRAEPRRRRD
jgi:DNA-binding GntR family transcriptional regulator